MRARSVLTYGCAPALALALAGLGTAFSLPAHAASTVHLIDTSPSSGVVARAPLAVSVTFDGALDRRGASMRIYGPDGEVSAAQAQVLGNAVRRELNPSVPGGQYTVIWSALTLDGAGLSGTFGFTAARGSGLYANEPARATDGPAAPSPTSEPPSPEATTGPGATTDPGATTGPGATTDPGPSVTTGSGAGADSGSGSGSGSGSTSLSARLMVVPVALGGLLVLASATVGLISGARRRSASDARATDGGSLVHGGLALPWQRHHS